MITLKEFLNKPYLRHLAIYKATQHNEQEYSISGKLFEAIKRLYKILHAKIKYHDARNIYKYLIWNLHMMRMSKSNSEVLDIVKCLIDEVSNDNFDGVVKLSGYDYFDNYVLETESYSSVITFWINIFAILRDTGMTEELIMIFNEEVLDPNEFWLIARIDMRHNWSAHLRMDEVRATGFVVNDGILQSVKSKVSDDYINWQPITLDKAFSIDLTKSYDDIEGPNWQTIPEQLKEVFDAKLLMSKMVTDQQ